MRAGLFRRTYLGILRVIALSTWFLLAIVATELRASETGNALPTVPDHTAEYPVLPQPQEFRTEERPNGVGFGYWMDNDRILVNVYVRPSKLSWPKAELIEWNTRSGEITHRGEGTIKCFSLNGNVVLNPNDNSPASWKNRQPFLAGPLGGPYESIPADTPAGQPTRTSQYFFNPFSCKVYPRSAGVLYPIPSITTPLLEGDGWFAAIVRGGWTRYGDSDLVFVRPNGEEAWRKEFSRDERQFSTSDMRYVPWLKKYLIPNSPSSEQFPRQAYLLDPQQGTLETQSWPVSHEKFGARFYPARISLLSLTRLSALGPEDKEALQMSGVYLAKPDGSVVKVHHLEADYFARLKQGVPFLVVSPNGCRVFVNAGVFDICKGDE